MKKSEPLAHTHNWHDVERAVAAFEESYASNRGADPAAYCPPTSDPLYLPVAVELVRAELELTSQTDRPKRLDDYRNTFPALFADRASLAAVAFEEYRTRQHLKERVSPEEYREKYGIDTSTWSAAAAVDSRRDQMGLTAIVACLPGDAQAMVDGADLEAGRFPEPGTEARGFRFVRELGRGAFARVYLAQQLDLAGRLVALKLSTRLVAEAQTLARLQHTNIVPVYSVHQAGRFHVVCMPYLGSVTLADVIGRLRKQGSVPLLADGMLGTVIDQQTELSFTRSGHTTQDSTEPTLTQVESGAPPRFTGQLDALRRKTHVDAALWMGAELADGLAHAHDRGIIHRDLKPANVLLNDDGRPMLLDFNLAGDVRLSDLAAGFVGGTPSYMAPEHLDAVLGAETVVDARSDVFSLGLILFELLTARPPYPIPSGRLREQMSELLHMRSLDPPRASMFNSAVTPAIDAMLSKCLAANSSDRYQSARHLREDILLHLDNRSLRHVREPSIKERFKKTIRRNPWMKSAPLWAAVLAVVAGLGTGGFIYRGRQLEHSEAVGNLAAFRDDADVAMSRLVVPDPSEPELKEGLLRGYGALSRYQFPEMTLEQWNASAAVRSLPPEEQQKLRGEIGELAFLIAGYEHVRADRAVDPIPRLAGIETALKWNQLAADTLGADESRRYYVTRQKAQLISANRKSEQPTEPLAGEGESPQQPPSLRLEFVRLNSRRQYHEALALLRRNEPGHNGTSWYWRTRGLYNTALREWTDAAASFTTALALSRRDDSDLRSRRGFAYFNLKNYTAAAQDYDAAIRLQANDPALYRDRALARMGSGNFDGAIADLNVAESLDPSHTRVYFIRSQIFARSGNREAARREMEEGLRKTPGDEISWITRGIARITRDPAAAVADFDAALKINPSSQLAMQNKANVLAEQLGQTVEAIAVLDRLIELHPCYVNARTGRGVLLARLGRRDAALVDAIAALKMDDAPLTLYQVAGIYSLTSKTQPEDRKQALRLLASAFQEKQLLRYVLSDRELDPIRADAEFLKLIEAAHILDVTATKDRH